MKLSEGTEVFIGPPAKPLPPQISAALGKSLGKLAEILEAHLPQMYAPGKLDPPAQVLVVVLEDDAVSLEPAIGRVISTILPSTAYLDVMELRTNSPLLPTVRMCGCALDLKR